MEFKWHDLEYLRLINEVFEDGVRKGDRTGTGTISTFGSQMKFDLTGGSIPMLTTKKMHIRSIIYEILWYLKGDTNVQYLQDNKVRIWNEWADDNGDLGPVYGAMWRKWPTKPHAYINYNIDPPQAVVTQQTIDQVANVIHALKTNPNDRRIIISAWNPTFLPEGGKSFEENVAEGNQALPPCHAFVQFWANDGKLRCKLTQRSCDVGLGVPFNIVQYSILTHMIAQVVGMEAEQFIWSGGDVHIYNNHVDALTEQLRRDPYPSPILELNPSVNSIDDFEYEDFSILDYQSHDAIKMEVSV